MADIPPFDNVEWDLEGQYGYPLLNRLRQGGRTLWICVLFVVLIIISTGQLIFSHARKVGAPLILKFTFAAAYLGEAIFWRWLSMGSERS